MVRSRWSQPRDLVDALEELADTADLIAAERAGALDDVEDELFRFGRIVAGSPSCAPRWPTGRPDGSAKAALLRTLLGGRANPVTVRLVDRLVTAPRGRSLEGGIESLSKLAAARRGRTVAAVVSAVPLSDQQKQRLGAALARLYGRQVHLNLDVDPAVLGGVTGADRRRGHQRLRRRPPRRGAPAAWPADSHRPRRARTQRTQSCGRGRGTAED